MSDGRRILVDVKRSGRIDRSQRDRPILPDELLLRLDANYEKYTVEEVSRVGKKSEFAKGVGPPLCVEIWMLL